MIKNKTVRKGVQIGALVGGLAGATSGSGVIAGGALGVAVDTVDKSSKTMKYGKTKNRKKESIRDLF